MEVKTARRQQLLPAVYDNNAVISSVHQDDILKLKPPAVDSWPK